MPVCLRSFHPHTPLYIAFFALLSGVNLCFASRDEKVMLVATDVFSGFLLVCAYALPMLFEWEKEIIKEGAQHLLEQTKEDVSPQLQSVVVDDKETEGLLDDASQVLDQSSLVRSYKGVTFVMAVAFGVMSGFIGFVLCSLKPSLSKSNWVTSLVVGLVMGIIMGAFVAPDPVSDENPSLSQS